MPTRGHCCLDLLILKDFFSLPLCTEDSFYSPHTIQGCGDALRSLCQVGFLVFVLYFVFVFFCCFFFLWVSVRESSQLWMIKAMETITRLLIGALGPKKNLNSQWLKVANGNLHR